MLDKIVKVPNALDWYASKYLFKKATIKRNLKYFEIFGIEKYEMRLSLHDPKKLGEKYVTFLKYGQFSNSV